MGEVTSCLYLNIQVALLQVSACVSLSLLWQVITSPPRLKESTWPRGSSTLPEQEGTN